IGMKRTCASLWLIFVMALLTLNMSVNTSAQSIAELKKMANNGDAAAQTYLGTLYDFGHGVPQNYEQAALWYRKAADQGDAKAQTYLGILYDFGHGVPQNYEQAALWYRKAADQGYAAAQTNLGILYDFGHGVPQNHAEAYFWINISVAKELNPEKRSKKEEIRDAI